MQVKNTLNFQNNFIMETILFSCITCQFALAGFNNRVKLKLYFEFAQLLHVPANINNTGASDRLCPAIG